MMIIFPSLLISLESQYYTKEELQVLQTLPEEEKKNFAAQLSLIETNRITNDAVRILKEPICLNQDPHAPLHGMKFVMKGNIPVAGLNYDIG